jgi:hypothetical protein
MLFRKRSFRRVEMMRELRRENREKNVSIGVWYQALEMFLNDIDSLITFWSIPSLHTRNPKEIEADNRGNSHIAFTCQSSDINETLYSSVCIGKKA